ncbi:MAG: flagellar biosynthesis protein FlhF [Sedimentisphaerales bacterium]|nr:flagellar biosynthesis protein FlhF [Sedimentisphaerales bacterium]
MHNTTTKVSPVGHGLKRFHAPTMAQALAAVKKYFGPDAIVVQTRTVKQSGFLGFGSRNVAEITARAATAADTPRRELNPLADRLRSRYGTARAVSSVSQSSGNVGSRLVGQVAVPKRVSVPVAMPAQPVDDSAVRQEIGDIRKLVESLVKEQRQLHSPQMPEQLFDIYLDLIQREVADEIARELIDNVQRDMTGNQAKNADIVREKLAGVMEDMIAAAGPVCRNVDGRARVVALIGPTGVGKTTTVAKLAAEFKLRQHKKVGLITIDTYRIGAVDQLRMYAQILGVPLKVVLSPAELKEAVAEMSHYDVVLIDTAGRAQTDKLKLKELQTFLDAAKPDETHLVLSTTAHHAHMLSAAQEFKKVGVDRLILTKLDEAISFGVVLSVMRKVDASLSYVTTGQAVPDDIEVGTGRKLACMLLGIDKINSNSDSKDSQMATPAS